MQKDNSMSVKHFCTLFDSNYLVKGMAMLRSLARNCQSAHVHVLCMDEQTRRILENSELSSLTCISLSDIEDDELLSLKPDRSVAEYCWTLSPCLPWFVLKNNPDIDFITYLDADLYFYSPVQELFDEIGSASIVVIEHRFPPQFKHLEAKGRFCVEWVSFRRDDEGMRCLAEWREQCIEWCFYRLEEDRMGDQKYLDKWPEKYHNLHILEHLGAGVAPWNYSQYRHSQGDNGQLLVNKVPLIFYHFHQLQILSNGRFDRLSNYYREMGPEPDYAYKEYESELTNILGELREKIPGFKMGVKSILRIKLQRQVQWIFPDYIKNILKRFIKAV